MIDNFSRSLTMSFYGLLGSAIFVSKIRLLSVKNWSSLWDKEILHGYLPMS